MPDYLPSPFDRAIAFILQPHIEGGYSNDPDDPGGETKYGISKRSYPHLDIKNLTREDAVAIYRKDYWNHCKCNELPVPFALILFDSAVNQGQQMAMQLLQRALGVPDDGIIGPITIAAAHRASIRATVIEFVARRAHRYATSKNLARFGLGWFRRLAECHQLSLEP